MTQVETITSFIKGNGGTVKKATVKKGEEGSYTVCIKGFLMGSKDLSLKYEISFADGVLTVKNTGCLYFNELRHGTPLQDGFCKLDISEKLEEHLLLERLYSWHLAATEWLKQAAILIDRELGIVIPEEEKPRQKKQTTIKEIVLRRASQENPVFARVTGKDLKNTLVACVGVETVSFEENKYYTRDAECARLWVLEGECLSERRVLELDEIFLNETLEATEQLMSLYRDTVGSVKVTIWTYVYPEVDIPEGMSSYEMYCLDIRPVAKFEYTPEDVHTIDEAEEWVLKHHPSEYIGMGCKTTNGAFLCGAVPQAYGEGSKWATRKGREEITKQIADKIGYEVGDFDYTLADKAIAEQD